MSPVIRIAIRRIKQNLIKSLLCMAAVCFSMLVISFFCFFERQALSTENGAYRALPFGKFVISLRLCMNITVVFLIMITFLTVRIYCRMRSEENARTLAVLTSVGATAKQRRAFVMTELLILYAFPIIVGVLAGCVFGTLAGGRFPMASNAGASDLLEASLMAVLLIAAGILFVYLANILPTLSLKKKSVISCVNRQNQKAMEEKHSYRKSQTFQAQSVLKRLAKKSVDYYDKIYNGIALSFALSALYPILGVLMFSYIGKSDVVIDTNPYDGVDTSVAVFSVLEPLGGFLVVCFLILTVVGVLQAVMMVRSQILSRKKSAQVYLSIGMPNADIKRLIRYELRSVLLRTAVLLLVGVILINGCFELFMGL